MSKGYVQLELELDWGGIPWHGVSPRYLCRVNSERRFGGTGRANQDAQRETKGPTKEVLQLWLFDEAIS